MSACVQSQIITMECLAGRADAESVLDYKILLNENIENAVRKLRET